MRRQIAAVTDGNDPTRVSFAPVGRRARTRWMACGFLCLLGLWPLVAAAELPTQSRSGTTGDPRGEISSPSAEELYRLGTEALAASRYKESIRFLEQAAVRQKTDVELYYWLGVAYWSREQGEHALSSYRRAVALDPKGRSEWSLYALENLAEVYTRTDHVQEARTTYRRALARETRPEWIARIQNQVAELVLALGDYETDDATVYNERGEIIGGVGPGWMHTNRNFEIARQTNDPKKEEKYYRLAIDTDPQMYQPYFNLGLALIHQGRYREAIPWLKKSDEVWKADYTVNPHRVDKSDAHAFLALCYLELGEIDKAGSHSQRAQAAGPTNYWETLYAGRVEIALGRADDVLPILETLARDNPEHAETLYALSLAHATLGRLETARETLLAAIDVIPENHPWMVRLRDEWKRSLR